MTVAEKLQKLPFEELIRNQTVQSMRRFITSARSAHTKAVNKIKNVGEVSLAQIQFEGAGKRKKLSDLSWNQLLIELAREQAFFQSETSSVEGIRSLNREQDARIFGMDEQGNPLYSMNPAERKKYWEIYNEFQNQKNNENSRFGSNDVQRVLADAIKSSSTVPLMDMLNNAEAKLQQAKLVTSPKEGFNVLSGRGDGLTR